MEFDGNQTEQQQILNNSDLTIDQLCKHLVLAKSYAILAVTKNTTTHAHGITDDGSVWPLIEIPELLPLTEYFERIMVRSDGYSFEVLCIKDRLRADSPPTSIDLTELTDIGNSCVKYAGKVQGTQLPVCFQIWELCNNTSCDTKHLEALRMLPRRKKKVRVFSWSLNIETGSVWTNTTFNGRLSGRKFVENTLHAVAAGTDPEADLPVVIGETIDHPLMTYALAAGIVAIFAVQLIWGDFTGFLSPTPESLVAFGGVFRPAIVENGQWYRLFSAAFLHGGLLHAGFIIGYLLLRNWPKDKKVPRFERVARIIGVVGSILICVSLAQALRISFS